MNIQLPDKSSVSVRFMKDQSCKLTFHALKLEHQVVTLKPDIRPSVKLVMFMYEYIRNKYKYNKYVY